MTQEAASPANTAIQGEHPVEEIAATTMMAIINNCPWAKLMTRVT